MDEGRETTRRHGQRRLVLLRHAKAERGSEALIDEDRPLAPTGRVQAGAVGKLLYEAGLTPQVALVSTALRTRQTWDVLSRKLPGDAVQVVLEPDLYLADVADVLGLVRALGPHVTTAMVVGHEPTMAATAARLAGPGSSDAALAQVRVGVPTATWAVVESTEPWQDWGRGSAVLTSVGRPV